MTALIYEGPALVKRINRGLCRLLERRRIDPHQPGGRHGEPVTFGVR